ncbi:MAG TPA: hypothetical protein VMM92_11920, partial [Thermoanaerobaculia bacterium]|nr:hypothetical protein [Thermoanaerobaculia bacterium]
PNISTELVFNPNGSFVELSDGTARITGTLVSSSHPTQGFQVDFELGGFSGETPVGSPKKELASSAYINNGGPVDPSTWYFYTQFTGTLIGTGDFAGASLTFVNTGPAFQVGIGANGKNLNFGASAWLKWTVKSQPTHGTAFPVTGQGDINVDIFNCGGQRSVGSGTGAGSNLFWRTTPPSNWPTSPIALGSGSFTRTQSLKLLLPASQVDKSYTLAMELLSAQLNAKAGAPTSCVYSTMTSAQTWLALHAIGSKVGINSSAWTQGLALTQSLDNYNQGNLCATQRTH